MYNYYLEEKIKKEKESQEKNKENEKIESAKRKSNFFKIY